MDNYNYSYNMQSPQKPPNIFKSFVYAFVPARYDQLIKVKTGSLIGFVTLLTLLGALISMTLFGISFIGETMEEIPNIVIRDGRLYTDDECMTATQISYLLVTDDVDGFSYEYARAVADQGYRQIMLVGREKMSVMRYGEYQELYLADLVGEGEIVLKDVVRPFLFLAIAIIFVIYYIGSASWYFLCSAVLLLIGLIYAQAFKRRLGAGAIFRIAVYSKVLMYVATTLVSALSLLRFSVPMLLRVVITLIFMALIFHFMPREDENRTWLPGQPGGPPTQM